ncbi:MAG: 23S rRNA (adenine(2503)-C(2))-methyltransferase RlmN [Desulfamplus sp.]|nr:23S rRNA (adenine(2503)-C(2))-methyltransferase RlmN [Desulfamplus sp.]
MRDIKEFTRAELASWFEDHGMKSFRAGQVFKWIYLRQADNFDEMTDLAKDARALLNEHFYIPRLQIESTQFSADGTEKLLFKLEDGNYIESVLIPQKDHFTLCISSQVGCAQGCKFCLTAKGGFVRNLTVAEIISQVRDARKHLAKRFEGNDQEDIKVQEGGKAGSLVNIVFMGMGEPLANYDAVVKSLHTLTDSDFGLKFSPRRVTLSTCGLVPEIRRLCMDTDANLAISLNATDDETRSMLMPINRRYPIKELLEACRSYKLKSRDKITFEYILIKGVNDSDDDAKRLVSMLGPIKSKMNIIPFNQHEKSDFKRPSSDEVSRFVQILLDRQVTAIVRKSKGDDISAACGQLRAKMV